jgi:trehalose-phosphatase
VGLGTRLESKPGGIAIHWRGLSPEEASSVEHKTREVCTKFLKGSGLSLLQFDGGLELRAPAKNKGDAVSAILAEEGRSAAVAYLGDDETDENAFRAIKGRGLAVLVRPEPRPTMADAWLRPPDDLGQFLRDWLLACGAEA